MAETTDREQELAALHRSYRMMETDRQKYSEESQVLSAPAIPAPAWATPTHAHTNTPAGINHSCRETAAGGVCSYRAHHCVLAVTASGS